MKPWVFLNYWVARARAAPMPPKVYACLLLWLSRLHFFLQGPARKAFWGVGFPVFSVDFRRIFGHFQATIIGTDTLEIETGKAIHK